MRAACGYATTASMDGRDILLALRGSFEAQADATRAAAQQAYMKSTLPFYGLPAARVAATCRQVFALYPFESPAAWRADTWGVFYGASRREERYAALALAAHRSARELQGLPRTPRAQLPPDAEARALAAMELYTSMIREGAWWDLVDALAVHHVGPLLAAHRASVAPLVRAFMHDDDVWIRRSAIIAQLGQRVETDTELLTDAIDAALDDTTFWLRKAIGWALRDYAKTDAPWVIDFVAARADRMSGLSQREALRRVR